MRFKRFLSLLFAIALFVSCLQIAPNTKAKGATTTRYTVLVIDESGSMYGTPMEKQKQAAKRFCKEILKANGTNYVALVGIDSSARIIEDFSNNLSVLDDAIDGLYDRGGTNINDALNIADGLLSNIGSNNTIKNIVLCTDGLPESGSTSYDGPYDWDDFYYYEYANYVYQTAQSLKKKYNIYTLGFFHNLDDYGLSFARKFMNDLQNAGYYEVTDPDKLQFTFGEISSDIIEESNNPIIIVPGIMGSRLYQPSNGSRIWDPAFLSGTWGTLGGKIVYGKKVTLKNNLVNMSKEIKGNREYGAANTYKKLVDNICDTFPNREVYFFSYDFRNDNRVSASRLKDEINSVLGSKYKKVDLVCHSMGGLVASHYVSVNGTSKLGRVITLGTPYEGAPKLVNCVLTNKVVDDSIKDPILTMMGLNREVKSSFPSLAQLAGTKTLYKKLPCYELKVLGGLENKISYTSYKSKMKAIFGNKYDSAEAFHNEIKDSNGYNKLLNFKDSYFVVGKGHKTISGLTFYGGNTKNSIDCGSLKYCDGDGTVPYQSSTMNGNLTKKKDKYHYTEIVGTHGGICENKNSLKWVDSILKRENSSYNEVKKKKKYTIVRIACPVDVKVKKGNEELNSANTKKISASFGTIDYVGKNADIKMVCLDGDDYQLNLNGTGKGKMNLSVENYNENGKLIREANYNNVKVNSKTMMYTKTTTKASKLSVDTNGNGKIDKKIKAKVFSNKKSKKTKIKSIKKSYFGFTVKWKKIKSANGYEVQYSKAKSFKKSKKQTVKGSTFLSVNNLKKGKKYFFRVRAYSVKKGVTTYYPWSKTKKKKFK